MGKKGVNRNTRRMGYGIGDPSLRDRWGSGLLETLFSGAPSERGFNRLRSVGSETRRPYALDKILRKPSIEREVHVSGACLSVWQGLSM